MLFLYFYLVNLNEALNEEIIYVLDEKSESSRRDFFGQLPRKMNGLSTVSLHKSPYSNCTRIQLEYHSNCRIYSYDNTRSIINKNKLKVCISPPDRR